MKKIALFSISFLCLFSTAKAQEYKLKLANSADRKVTFEIDAGNIKIEGYNGDEILIQASSGLEPVPERAKGLTPLYNSAVDNSGIGLAVTQEGNGVKIEKATRKEIRYTIKLPNKVSILYIETNWQGSKISVNNMAGDLEFRTNNADMDLTNVTGPVVANSTGGEIKIVFSSLSQSKPTAISTVGGDIDITLPANTKSNMKLKSITGEMYTDFDLGIKKQKDNLARISGMSNIDGTTNGGGVEVQLNTIGSNIYIRKQK